MPGGRSSSPATQACLSIGKDVDDAMGALDRNSSRLKGALNKNYDRADLDKHRFGKLIDLLIGRVFEYFLPQFACAESKNGDQIYTPSCVVRLLVGMLAPYKGRIYDSACGSGGHPLPLGKPECSGDSQQASTAT